MTALSYSSTVNARATVLSFVRAYMATHDDSPSLGEIADGVRSTKPAVARVIAGLERDGELVRLPAPPRTKRRIVLPEQHVRALTLLRALGYEINGTLRPSPATAGVTDWILLDPTLRSDAA